MRSGWLGENFRGALSISAGDYGIFVQGPAARVFLAILAVVVVAKLWAARRLDSVTLPPDGSASNGGEGR